MMRKIETVARQNPAEYGGALEVVGKFRSRVEARRAVAEFADNNIVKGETEIRKNVMRSSDGKRELNLST